MKSNSRSKYSPVNSAESNRERPTMVIAKPRPINLRTPIGQNVPVLVAAPCSAHGRRTAHNIHRALLNRGVRAVLQEDPEDSLMRSALGPVIVVGNLADSRCVKWLYYRARCATDLWYPGPGGHELRTLCNPFGSGHNLILAGYSDEDGARNVGEVLLARLADPIPHLRELHVTRLPMSTADVQDSRTIPLPLSAAEIANSTQGDVTGYLYYLTGEPEMGQVYRKAWQAYLACGYVKSTAIVQVHMYSLWRLLPWRLIEDMDLFNQEERLAIARFIYGWAESDEGWHYVANCTRTQRPNNQRQNHEVIPALALIYAAEYFETFYPELTGPARWRTVAQTAFASYGSSWKPLEDGLCHGWWLGQPLMLEHALLDPTHQYFIQGGARQAAECAMAVVNNDGWMPSAGDSALRRQFPGVILRIAADYFRDGRYKFVHDLAPPSRRLAWPCLLPRAFDSGIKPQLPDDHVGVTVVPIDPLLYHIWEREPELAVDAVTSPPTAPIEQCFDKLAVRTGWNLTDDYLLIDGLGGGSHSYDDAGGIVEYSRLGVAIIVQEDSYVYSAPADHSLVTIVRDGVTGIIPGFAILEDKQIDATGTVYLRIRSKNYAGTDWIREVHLLPGKCAVFVDTVTANMAGDFAVEAHFRTPGRLALEGQVARGQRKSPCCEEVEIRLASLSDASCLRVTEVPVHLRYPRADDQAYWRDRYRTDEMVLMSFAARETTHLEPGESVRLVHMAQARAPRELHINLMHAGPALFILEGETRTPLKSFMKPLEPTALTTRDVATDLEGLRLFFAIGADISVLSPLEKGAFAVGTKSGGLSYVDNHGKVRWNVELTGPIHDIGVTSGQAMLLAAGHGLAELTAFNARGEQQWTTHIVHEPSPWPWWELPSPAPVQVAGGMAGGKEFFAVGCGDLQLRCFDRKGKEHWKWRYNEGVPGRVVVTDVNGSGNSAIVVGGEILSDQSTCRILTPDGMMVAELPVEGWTSMLTAITFGGDKSRRFIGCGANRGANLHLFELMDGQWQRRWLKRAGGQVTGIGIFAAEDRMIVATSQGFLLGYDMKGTQLWHLLFAQGLRHLVPIGNRVILVDDKGGVHLANLAGSVEKRGSLPKPCTLATAYDHGMYFSCGSEVWQYLLPGEIAQPMT